MTSTTNIGGHDYGRSDLSTAVPVTPYVTTDDINRTFPAPINRDLAALAVEIHASNVAAGWWTDLKTGESTLATRNRPEMLMLAVSELAEAADGAMGDPDDKLPHLPMYDVELADFVIRQLDTIGAEVSLGATMPRFDLPGRYGIGYLRSVSREERLMTLVCQLSIAMEHYRKGRVQEYVNAMSVGVLIAFRIAEVEHIDLFDVIAQKRKFNATRADHKVENRKAAGGKAF